MSIVRRAAFGSLFLCGFALACGSGSSGGANDGTGGSAGSGTGGTSGSAGGGTGGSAGSGTCTANADYTGMYYGRYETDQALKDLLSGFADSIGCISADVVVDEAAGMVTATGDSFPPGSLGPRTYTAPLQEGDAVVIPIAAREFGVLELTIQCDGSASATLQAGPFRGTCSGTFSPMGGTLQCEVLGPGGPLGIIDVVITKTPPDVSDCSTPPPINPPPPGPDCSTIPLSPDVGGACTAGCMIAQGGACADAQCRALCLDSFTGCSQHCQRDESCLPLEQGGNRVMLTVDGMQYPAGACALETGSKQAYESCGSERCDGFNCLAFAGANTVGLCAPECFGSDSDCPPGPPGFTALCVLKDQTGRQFCALSCDPTDPTGTCPTDQSCLPSGSRPETEPVCLPTRM